MGLGGDGSSTREGVVLSEVPGFDAALANRGEQLLGGALGDVLVVPPTRGARVKNSLNAVVFQSAKAERVRESLAELGGVVAFP
jgi:hypothetical protein